MDIIAYSLPTITYIPLSDSKNQWPEFYCSVTRSSTIRLSLKNGKLSGDFVLEAHSSGTPPYKRSQSTSNLQENNVSFGDIKEKKSTSSSSSEYTVYHLQVKAVTEDSILEWEVQRRYSEFLLLHQFLTKLFVNSGNSKEISFSKELKSLFPKKTFINKSEKIISLRKNQLTDYLVSLFKYLNTEKLLRPAKKINEVNFINSLSNCILGFLDVDNRFAAPHFQYKESSAPHFYYYDTKKIIKRELWMKLNALERNVNNSIGNGEKLQNSFDDLKQSIMSQQFRQMHQLNNELKDSILKGDLFVIEKKSKNHLLICISSSSRIYIYPIQNLVTIKTESSLEQQFPYEFEAVLYNQMGGDKRCISISQIQEVRLLPQTFQTNGSSRMRLIFKDGSTLTFYSRNRIDIEQTITIHLKRYSNNRENIIQSLKEALIQRRTPYDEGNQEHEAMLISLWNTVFPDIPMDDRKNLSLWSKIGFQSEPSKDFRGAGFGALHYIVYCATHYTKQFRYIADKNRDYPLSVAGINVIDQIFRMLNVQDWDDMRLEDPRWDESIVFRFITEQCINTNYPLEEFFCFFLFLLDHIFVEENGTYFTFGDQMNKTKKKILEKLENENTLSFRILYETCFTEEYLDEMDLFWKPSF